MKAVSRTNWNRAGAVAGMIVGALACASAASAQEPRTARVKLPSDSQVRTVHYSVSDGMAVSEGDLLLGPVDAEGALIGQVGTSAISVPESSTWRDAVIPYRVEGKWGSSDGAVNDRIERAIAHWEERTPLRFVRYDENVHSRYLSIIASSVANVCEATVGSRGDFNYVRLASGCLEKTIIHELGHVAGLYHEHARGDRDQFVRVNWQNIDPDHHDEFCRRSGAPYSALEKQYCPGEPSGALERAYAYDLDSIMHYSSDAFARKDAPLGTRTLELLRAGNIDDNRELSAGDVSAVERMYAFDASSRRVPFCNAPSGEVCSSGDFNGDGRQDLISFHHGAYDGSSEVWVAISDEIVGYLPPRRWATGFCERSEEVCKVGDFDGDGADDILTFHHGAYGGSGTVFVYLSDGVGSFVYPGKPWASKFCERSEEVCDVGDFDRDGSDDIITFHHGAFNGSSTVFVYLSDGSQFVYPGAPWKSAFCHAGMTCRVADVDGDQYADAVAFFHGVHAGSYRDDVWVARSNGKALLAETKWHDQLCAEEDLCLLGDLNGDGRADALALQGRLGSVGGLTARALVATSQGSDFAVHVVQGAGRCGVRSNCVLSDNDGDGRDDIIAFPKRGDELWVSRSQLPLE